MMQQTKLIKKNINLIILASLMENMNINQNVFYINRYANMMQSALKQSCIFLNPEFFKNKNRCAKNAQ